MSVRRWLCEVGALKEALRRMIIRQRRTILDPLLLKVVFPYLEAGNHRTLLRLASYWNYQLSRPPKPNDGDAKQSHGVDRRLPQTLPNVARSLARWLQPQQVLAPIAIASVRGSRLFRLSRNDG